MDTQKAAHLLGLTTTNMEVEVIEKAYLDWYANYGGKNVDTLLQAYVQLSSQTSTWGVAFCELTTVIDNYRLMIQQGQTDAVLQTLCRSVQAQKPVLPALPSLIYLILLQKHTKDFTSIDLLRLYDKIVETGDATELMTLSKRYRAGTALKANTNIAYNEVEYRYYKHKYLAWTLGVFTLGICLYGMYQLIKPTKPATDTFAAVAALAPATDIPEMVDVKGGTFTMGDPTRPENESPFTTRVEDFEIGKYEVKVWQYLQYVHSFSRGANPNEDLSQSYKHYLENNPPGGPVVGVSWWDAIGYCNWLSKLEGLTPCYEILFDKDTNAPYAVIWDKAANGYRLPTEPEWEFAARGGLWSRGTIYSGSKNIADVAIYKKNAPKTPIINFAGQKKPNELGIYDMSGNVWEWCWGDYANLRTETNGCHQLDNQKLKLVLDKVSIRGGSYLEDAHFLRVSTRTFRTPERKMKNLGFRVVRNGGTQAIFTQKD